MRVVPAGMLPSMSVVTVTGSPTGSPASVSIWKVTSTAAGHPPEAIVVVWPGFTGPDAVSCGVPGTASTVTVPSAVFPNSSSPATV